MEGFYLQEGISKYIGDNRRAVIGGGKGPFSTGWVAEKTVDGLFSVRGFWAPHGVLHLKISNNLKPSALVGAPVGIMENQRL